MIANTFSKYTKYTVKELESYVADPNACVQKLEWTNLVSVLPKYLGNICEGVKACLTQKIGKYDRKVDGIILAFKNTKILSPLSAIRPNGVRIHVKVTSHFYVFRPVSGATLEGTIKYVSKNYLSAVIYRVFNVTIRLQRHRLQKQGTVISFIVKSFDIKCDLPFIEGELISTPEEQESGEVIVKKEKSPKQRVPIKTEPAEVICMRTKNEADIDSAGKEASDDSESDDDVKRSMKTILSKLEKEMSDATDSASDRAKPLEASKKKKRKNSDSVSIKKEKVPKQLKLNGHATANDAEESNDDMEHTINAILSGIQKDMSDVADSDQGTSKPDESKLATPSVVKTETTDKNSKRKKGSKPKQVKQNGHATKDDAGDDIEYSINAILSGLEKEMSDVADSDHGSSKLAQPTRVHVEITDKKPKRAKKGDDKGNKRKQTKKNGHATEDNASHYDDMESSIQALLSGIEKEMDEAVESVSGALRKEDSNPGKPSAIKKSSGKKKKKNDFNIDSMEEELLRKLAAEYSEQETEEPTIVKSAKPQKKNKKKPKTNEDDFETSIMSSILKCAAAHVDESESKNSPTSSPLKKTGKTARKSVRFDNTITEASFNAFDSSELFEISQLQSPTLSSTLKGN